MLPLVVGLVLSNPSWTATLLTPDPPIATACAGTTSGTTFTLSADCDTTASLTVPDGVTVDGAGHTITAHDPPVGFFTGGIITNAGTVMNIQNLTVRGTGFAFNSCAQLVQTGIFFDEAGGTVRNVSVVDITEHSGCNFGLGIRANALSGNPRTVTITGVTVTGYQRGGLVASGAMTMNVSNSTVGPADGVPSRPAQNDVQFSAGASGSVTDSSLIGSFFPNATSAGDGSRAFLLFAARDVTLARNTVTGVGSDFGMSVVANSTGIVLDHNRIARQPPPPGASDQHGTGVEVDATSAATLICNTFDGWRTDITGTTQPPCATQSPSPPTPPPTSRPSLPGPPLTGGTDRTDGHGEPLWQPICIAFAGVGGLLLALRWRRRGRE